MQTASVIYSNYVAKPLEARASARASGDFRLIL